MVCLVKCYTVMVCLVKCYRQCLSWLKCWLPGYVYLYGTWTGTSVWFILQTWHVVEVCISLFSKWDAMSVVKYSVTLECCEHLRLLGGDEAWVAWSLFGPVLPSKCCCIYTSGKAPHVIALIASAYYTCPANDFTCATGKCITSRWKCDFDNDCGNNEDEQNCSKLFLSAQGSFRSEKTGKVRENQKSLSSHQKVRKYRLFTNCQGKSGNLKFVG